MERVTRKIRTDMFGRILSVIISGIETAKGLQSTGSLS